MDVIDSATHFLCLFYISNQNWTWSIKTKYLKKKFMLFIHGNFITLADVGDISALAVGEKI